MTTYSSRAAVGSFCPHTTLCCLPVSRAYTGLEAHLSAPDRYCLLKLIIEQRHTVLAVFSASIPALAALFQMKARCKVKVPGFQVHRRFPGWLRRVPQVQDLFGAHSGCSN